MKSHPWGNSISHIYIYIYIYIYDWKAYSNPNMMTHLIPCFWSKPAGHLETTHSNKSLFSFLTFYYKSLEPFILMSKRSVIRDFTYPIFPFCICFFSDARVLTLLFFKLKIKDSKCSINFIKYQIIRSLCLKINTELLRYLIHVIGICYSVFSCWKQVFQNLSLTFEYMWPNAKLSANLLFTN